MISDSCIEVQTSPVERPSVPPSGERTLSDFFDRLTPFGATLMAMFGRAALPHRATLSHFLASVDHPSRQWIGTFAGRGNGDYQGELASALRAITTYLGLFALTTKVALVRLDGQYGDAVAIAQLIEAGGYLVTRARGYRVLEHPQIQRALAHPPTTRVTRVSSEEVVELFDAGWLQLDERVPQTRVIVARHRTPAAGKRVSVGKCGGRVGL